MPTEPRYTLSEAQAELARRDCDTYEHMYDVISDRTMDNPAGRPLSVRCHRCGKHWTVTGEV